MCGRFTLSSSPKVIAEIFHVLNVPELLPSRYNIAPTQPVAVVRAAEGGRELVTLKWGLVHSFADTLVANVAETADAKGVNSDPRTTRREREKGKAFSVSRCVC